MFRDRLALRLSGGAQDMPAPSAACRVRRRLEPPSVNGPDISLDQLLHNFPNATFVGRYSRSPRRRYQRQAIVGSNEQRQKQPLNLRSPHERTVDLLLHRVHNPVKTLTEFFERSMDSVALIDREVLLDERSKSVFVRPLSKIAISRCLGSRRTERIGEMLEKSATRQCAMRQLLVRGTCIKRSQRGVQPIR